MGRPLLLWCAAGPPRGADRIRDAAAAIPDLRTDGRAAGVAREPWSARPEVPATVVQHSRMIQETPSKALPLPLLRPARFEDYPQIERLESSHGLLTLRADDWRGLWLDNPLWRRSGEEWPIGWVLEDAAGAVVGSLGNITSLYTYRDCELIAATGRRWVVASEYRGLALWLMDEYFHQPAVDLFINTTVNALAVDAFSAFGSVRVPLGDWFTAAYWITRHRAFARTALRIKAV